MGSQPMRVGRLPARRRSPRFSASSRSWSRLGFGGAIIATVLLAAAVGLLALLCMRQIGGQTGDVLGAVEQTGEILILLVASAWL